MKFRLIAALAAFALASGLAQAQTKLKFAHVYEVSEPYHTAAVWAAGEIAKRTNNRYTMEVFPASTLGKETDTTPRPCGPTLGKNSPKLAGGREPSAATFFSQYSRPGWSSGDARISFK